MTKEKSKCIVKVGFSSTSIGFFMLLLKALHNDYIDSEGFLHEAFFLLPIGFFFFFIGIVVIIIGIILYITHRNK